ncbi:hypothetical protein JCM5350_003070 [Sporobolomyces pararoseus]
MVATNSPPPLVLIRTDEISQHGEVRTTFAESSSGSPVYFATSRYTPSIEGHKTTLYSRQSEVGSVSMDYFQLGRSREIKSTTFYTRPNFFSEKLVWKSFEGKQLRWKRDESGSLILIDHKSRQTLASAQTAISAAGQPMTTLKIHPSLLSNESRNKQPNSRLVTPLSSPSSISSNESSSSPKLKRVSVAPPPPPTLAYAHSSEKGMTLELVILSLLHQDYQRLHKERQRQEEADEKSNEWDPW